MIQLTRLNNTRLAVNCDLIKYVEQAPDTVITLLNGEKLVVRETTAEVIERVCEFRRSVLSVVAPSHSPLVEEQPESEISPNASASDSEGPSRG